MALMTCPECKQRVSSQATTCPHCGFPLAQSQAPDLEAILCGAPWLARSGTLVDAQLVAVFRPEHTFYGQTMPDPNRVAGIQMVATTTLSGTWQSAGSQLFLEFPLTMASGPAQTQIAIQFTRISEDSLSGVDRFVRPWEWQNIAGTPLGEHTVKQSTLSTMLSNLANMRHEMLKTIAANLPDEEPTNEKADARETTTRRARKKKE